MEKASTSSTTIPDQWSYCPSQNYPRLWIWNLHDLASTLKLQRFPEPMEINGLRGQEHSKFSVVTNTKEFTSKPITFTVVSKLKAVQPPTNVKDILEL